MSRPSSSLKERKLERLLAVPALTDFLSNSQNSIPVEFSQNLLLLPFITSWAPEHSGLN